MNLEIEKNEFVCVVGPSGCGKTTLLNIIAGLETFDSGSVLLMHGEDIIGPGQARSDLSAICALSTDDGRKNIEYGLKFITKADGSRYTKKRKRALAEHYIKMVNLTGFEDNYPALSGGMKQQVAIARRYALNSGGPLDGRTLRSAGCADRGTLQEEDLLRTWESEEEDDLLHHPRRRRRRSCFHHGW